MKIEMRLSLLAAGVFGALFLDDWDIERFRLTPDDWKALGEPDRITVTIQPGDLLNNEVENA